jgi:hypothetical protein
VWDSKVGRSYSLVGGAVGNVSLPYDDHDDSLSYWIRFVGHQTGFSLEHESRYGDVRIIGICPMCRGRTTFTLALGVPDASKGERDRSGVQVPVDAPPPMIWCDCGFPHANRPESAPDLGCGASWTVDL